MAKKSRIVMVAGSASHGGGSHGTSRLDVAYLADQLNKVGDGVEVVVSQGWPEDPDSLSPIQMPLLFIRTGGTGHLSIPHLEQISGLMEQGIGLAMLHYAVEVPKGEPGDRFLGLDRRLL